MIFKYMLGKKERIVSYEKKINVRFIITSKEYSHGACKNYDQISLLEF